MTDLTPNHPAVEAVAREIYVHDAPSNDPQTWPPTPTALADDYRGAAFAALTAALPHLTADDLRNTDAAEEIRTEGWLQGWAAGRDLDGDEDATPYLRNTPAGRALMAEGWEEGMLDHMGRGHVGSMSPKTISIIRERIADTNPYRGGDGAAS